MPLTLGVLAAAAASSVASNDVEPGVLGFLVVAGIGVALVFLVLLHEQAVPQDHPQPGDEQADGEQVKDPARTPEEHPSR